MLSIQPIQVHTHSSEHTHTPSVNTVFNQDGGRTRRHAQNGGGNNAPSVPSLTTYSCLPSQGLLHVSADLPESLHVSADLPESLNVAADLPESLHISADLPESLHVSADLPVASRLRRPVRVASRLRRPARVS